MTPGSTARATAERLRDDVRNAPDIDAAAAAARRMRELPEALLADGAAPSAVAQLLTAFNDALTRRLIALVGAEDTFSGARASWIVLGSGGRAEQTLATDQDNAIVVDAETLRADVRAKLVADAARVNAALDRCGYALCRGGVMAGSPECCLALGEWRERFAAWMDRPEPQALLNAAIFFDPRCVHGPPAGVDALRAWLASACRDRAPFLLLMAHNALGNAPPLGLFRDFVPARGGSHAGTIDLKINGVQLFVEAARVYALAAGVSATGTLERLAGAAERWRFGAQELSGWCDAFESIQSLRLRLNVAQHRRHAPLDNHLDPRTLEPSDRRALKAALTRARGLQRRLARDFALQGGGFGA